MARTDTLTNFLTDVADSIREKKGTSELIQASNFDTEIYSIESGSDLDEYFETNANSNPVNWVRDNFIKKVPSIIIDDSITNLTGFCSNVPYKIIPKIICNNNVTNFMSLYNSCNNATTIDVSGLNSENVTSMNYMFSGCNNLTDLNLSNIDATKINGTSNLSTIYQMFMNCSNLTNLVFLKNIGKGFIIQSENHQSCRVDLHWSNSLTHDSLMSVINSLYDLNLTYNVASGGTLYKQGLILGETNLAKLSPEEIAIATNKGWIVS